MCQADSVGCEGSDALMGARMAQLHRIQSDIENTFDLDLGHSGFDQDQLIVLATHPTTPAPGSIPGSGVRQASPGKLRPVVSSFTAWRSGRLR